MWYYAPLTRQDDCIPGFGQRCDHTVHKLPRLVPDQSRRKEDARGHRDGLTYHGVV